MAKLRPTLRLPSQTKNPQSTLKLAQARGAVLAACGSQGLTVNEHSARLVKKSVTGTGGADKS